MRLKGRYIHTDESHNMIAPRQVAPIVTQLFSPGSVLDVGCGTGTWLKAFDECGVLDYFGVDGAYIDILKLRIPLERFQPADLRKPLFLDRKFDLVVSLEVAEHIEAEYSDIFVESLIRHGDTILFSAAIPGQGGQNHVNEQWPDYWLKKFLAYGYTFHDIIRPRIWSDPLVDWWYRQNMFVVSRSWGPPLTRLSMVHPEMHINCMNSNKRAISSILEGNVGVKLGALIFLKSLWASLKVRSSFHSEDSPRSHKV